MTAAYPLSLAPLARGYNPLARSVRQLDGFPVLPGAFPIIGHMPALAVDLLALLRDAAARLGPVFHVDHGFSLMTLVVAHRDAFSLFKNKGADSSNMREGTIGDLFGDGVIVHDGAMHRHLRSALNGPFQPKGLTEAKVGELVAGIVERRVRAWVGKRRVRVLDETRELALEVMFRLVGVDERELDAWREHYETLLLLAIPLPIDLPGTPRWRGLRARAWLDERLARIVARARADRGATGILPALVQSRDEQGALLGDQELVDNLRLLFLAGHETSASIMAWMVAHLADRPDVWRRLRDEALAAEEVPRSPKELKRFPYAEAVFRETLRLHPPVASDGRRANVELEMLGRTVKKGTLVTVPLVLLARDPEVFPDPDTFRPERWLGRSEPISPLELAQFGGGPHFCLGYHLAWMEIVQFAAALGRALPAAGPRLEGAFPAPRYMPLLHPDASTRARFD